MAPRIDENLWCRPKLLAGFRAMTFSRACQWLKAVQRSKIRSLTFMLMPGHSDTRGYERAYRMTGCATILVGQRLYHADISINLKDTGRVKDCQCKVNQYRGCMN